MVYKMYIYTFLAPKFYFILPVSALLTLTADRQYLIHPDSASL